MNSNDALLTLSELVLTKNNDGAARFARQNLRKIAKLNPDKNDRVLDILKKDRNHKFSKNLRYAQTPLPVDQDSRLELIKTSISAKVLPDTRWPEQVQIPLEEVLEERKFEEKLISAGLDPINSLLFVGPPGVGKTMAASWLALMMNKPLYVLDLSAVMSSYLGRTGNNIRTVLDFAKSKSAVLLLDEFDAIAKRRDDNSEIGELKRLVTVLLQEIEDWPSDGLLIAATNHDELLDPAVWRRFNKTIYFPNPSYKDIVKFISSSLEGRIEDTSIIPLISLFYIGETYATIDRELKSFRRKSILNDVPLNSLLKEFLDTSSNSIDKTDKEKMKQLAKNLLMHKVSQRQTSLITGISRPTLRQILEEET